VKKLRMSARMSTARYSGAVLLCGVFAGWTTTGFAQNPLNGNQQAQHVDKEHPENQTAREAGQRSMRIVSAPLSPPILAGLPGMMIRPPHMNSVSGPGAQVDGPVVVGKPYSAIATTEHVQMLVDGNRIVNTMRAVQYRDTQGRTRHEQLAPDGPGQAISFGDQPLTVRISDPVNSESWLLVPRDRMAFRLPRLEMLSAADGHLDGTIVIEGPDGAPLEAAVGTGAHVSGVLPPFDGFPDGPPRTTPLGERRLEGLDTRGERTEHTIPANTLGNELPIVRTTEQWRSEAIDAVVLMTLHDPLGGNVTYTLTDVRTTEMPAELFEVPADYQRSEDLVQAME